MLFNNGYYEKVALQMLYSIIPNLDYPSAFSNWLNLWLELAETNKELAVCGSDANNEIKKINAEYLPHVITAGSTGDSEIPFLKERFVKDKTLFYICKNRACDLPNNSTHETINNLKI